MADALLSDLATEIVKKLASAALQEIQLVCSFETESHKLEDTISTIKAVLFDVQQQQQDTNSQASDWLEKLKEVVDDADDLLDDFSTEDLRRKEITANKKAKKVRIFFSSSNQLSFRVKMSHKVKAIRERLDAIAENKIKFHFNVERPIDMQVQIKKREEDSHSFVRAEQVIGREDDKKAIVELLMDYNVQENVSVIAILGFGGLGKTKLAQLVFNDEKVQQHFELKTWVCVSDVFDVKQVAKNIIESATHEKSKNLRMQEVQNQLRKEIDGKKYLLVLDNVWNEDRDRWIDLRDLLMGGARGSKILITTRAKLVATVSGANSLYHLKGLSEQESWSLFKQMAFKEEDLQNPRRVEIGKEIANKCAGVPLAIRVLGSLLYSNDTMNEWLNFKNKDMAKIIQEENKILPILKLSYDHLPSYLKQCFAFCRMYPKGHVIDKQQLIQLWTAHGFIRASNEDQDMEDIGDLYFMNLLRRSFFQDDEADEFGDIISCKMHDFMHDLAQLVAGTESSMVNLDTKDVSPKIRHVSFDLSIDSRLSLKIPAPLLGAVKIRTFFLPAQQQITGFLSMELENSVYSSIASNFKRLRVLDLHNLGMKEVTSCISKLKHLRYLDLSGNPDIKTLPNSITKLRNLQTLKLWGCYGLEGYPRDIRKMVSLRHLEFDYSREMCDRGLGQLTCLRTLLRFIVSQRNSLRELKYLNNLRGELVIHLWWRLRHSELPRLKDAEEANLRGKEYLQSLIFNFGDNKDDELELVLEALRPHANLKKLEIKYYMGVRLPTWMSLPSLLPNLVHISIRYCKGCKHLPKIHQFPSLKSLYLGVLNSVEYIDDNSCGASSRDPTTTTFFPSLKSLKLWAMPNLKGWWKNKAAAAAAANRLLPPSFPCLVESNFMNCPQLTSMPLQPTVVKLQFRKISYKVVQRQLLMMPKATTSSSSLLPLSNLEELVIDDIDDLVTLPEEAFPLLTSLLKLEFSRCPRLTSLSRGMRHLTALLSLKVRDCKELDLLDGDDGGMHFQGLSNLTSMTISNIPKLESLPADLQHITTLQSLHIEDCENLKSLPDWIGNLTSLQRLSIDNCRRLKSLPQAMHQLTALQQLQIEYCSHELYDRCQKETGEDWPKIAHIPELVIKDLPPEPSSL